MTEFRFPHPYDNVKQAIDKAEDGLTGSLSNLAVQLLDENNRAVEDAIDGGSTRGTFISDTEGGVSSSTIVSFEWVIPAKAESLFSGYVTGAALGVPAGQTLFMEVNGIEYSKLSSDPGVPCAVTAGITALTTSDVTIDIDMRWEAGAGTADFSVTGSGVYIGG